MMENVVVLEDFHHLSFWNLKSFQTKRAIVVSARVHPGEAPSSWMMKGLIDFITGDSIVAKKLRHKFIFKLIPMLNPDGVIVGNTRNSLTGKDLNRQYRTVIREAYPSIWYTKMMIKRLTEDCGVYMYCDLHAHSRKHNIFIYGCENKRVPEKKLTEQVFPLMMHKNVADKVSRRCSQLDLYSSWAKTKLKAKKEYEKIARKLYFSNLISVFVRKLQIQSPTEQRRNRTDCCLDAWRDEQLHNRGIIWWFFARQPKYDTFFYCRKLK